jgi:hypothetical protein
LGLMDQGLMDQGATSLLGRGRVHRFGEVEGLGYGDQAIRFAEPISRLSCLQPLLPRLAFGKSHTTKTMTAMRHKTSTITTFGLALGRYIPYPPRAPTCSRCSASLTTLCSRTPIPYPSWVVPLPGSRDRVIPISRYLWRNHGRDIFIRFWPC